MRYLWEHVAFEHSCNVWAWNGSLQDKFELLDMA